MSILSASKDRMVESMGPSMLNGSVLKPYGRIVDLKLSSRDKTLQLTLDLKGEQELIHIDVREYELINDQGRCFLIIRDIATSREWLTALAQHLAVGKRLEVPPEATKVIARFL